MAIRINRTAKKVGSNGTSFIKGVEIEDWKREEKYEWKDFQAERACVSVSWVDGKIGERPDLYIGNEYGDAFSWEELESVHLAITAALYWRDEKLPEAVKVRKKPEFDSDERWGSNIGGAQKHWMLMRQILLNQSAILEIFAEHYEDVEVMQAIAGSRIRETSAMLENLLSRV